MNLSFSTRGWQSLGWEELIETAEEMRFPESSFIISTNVRNFMKKAARSINTAPPPLQEPCVKKA